MVTHNTQRERRKNSMKKHIVVSIFALCFVLTGLAHASTVTVATVEGMIGPATAKFMVQALDRAEQRGSACLIYQLDTPGGLTNRCARSSSG